MRLLRLSLITAVALLLPVAALPWTEPMFVLYRCQALYAESSQIASCHIEMASQIRSLKRTLLPTLKSRNRGGPQRPTAPLLRRPVIV